MSDFLVKLITGLLKSLLNAFTPKSVDGVKSGELEKKLHDKIQKDGWK